MTTKYNSELNCDNVNDDLKSESIYDPPQPVFTCSHSTIETPEQCVKSVQS